MKRTKIYCAILLVLSLLCSSNFTVMAWGTEFAINWLVNFEDGVSGYVYAPTPYGFIVENYDNETQTAYTALIDDSGYVIPPTTKNFNSVSDCGLIEYEVYNPYHVGVMDLNGNVVISADKYDSIFVITEDRFLVDVRENVDEYNFISHQGIIDSKGNEIVPIDKYTFDEIHESFNHFQNFRVYDENDNIAIIDYNGNFLVPFGTDDNAEPTCIADRYLTYDETQNKSYLRKQDGSNIAEFNGKARFVPYNYIEVSEEDENHNITAYEYDMDGNLINVFEYGNGGRPFVYKDINDDKTRYQVEDFYDEKNGWYDVITDTFTGNTYTFDNSDYHIDWIYDNGLVKVLSSDWTDVGLVTMNHDVVIPFGEYDSIRYCEELNIFALGKDGKIAIAKIDPVTVNVSGKNVIFDQNPVSKDGRTLVPLRAIFEALGATVDWDGNTQTITSTFLNTTIKLTVGTNKMYVNGQEVILDVPAEVINNRTLVPVRAISQAFGFSVEWDSNTRTVYITK